MQSEQSLKSTLARAVAQVLRPLVRLLLRHSVPYTVFQELAKRVYVEVALSDFAIPGKKASISRASILTGLSRKDVQRLLDEPAGEAGGAAEGYNRAARVLTGWVRDPDFLDAQGQPRALDSDGPQGFAALVKRHSGDMPVRAVLDELLRVGAVARDDAGRIVPLQRAYVPQQGLLEKLGILGRDAADLIDTIDHNLQHGADDPRFQRKVMYHAIPDRDLAAFRRLSAAQAQALLESLDGWLARHDVDDPPGEAPAPRSRVGLGIYYFEAPAAPDHEKGSP